MIEKQESDKSNESLQNGFLRNRRWSSLRYFSQLQDFLSHRRLMGRIFTLCVDGKEPMQIAKALTADRVLTVKAYYAKQKGQAMPDKPHQWSAKSLAEILKGPEYTGCTVIFKTYSKSHKLKKRLNNAPENQRVSPIPNLRLSMKKYGNGYGSYGQTNTALPKQESRVYSPFYCIALIVETSCTSVRQTAFRPTKTTMYAPTTRVIRELPPRTLSARKP